MKPLPDQLIEINKRRRNGTETVKDIMLSLGANIDLDIYSHPYKDEILQSAPKVSSKTFKNVKIIYGF